jgi:CheY-like chemotaxis protein
MSKAPYIVLVDDDRQVIRLFKKVLEESGYAVTATTSGRKALALIKQSMPDLLITDLNMPEPDGFDLLIGERSRFPYLPIMVISGMKAPMLEAAKFVGAAATLEKPVAAEALVAKVRAVLGK